MFQLVKILTAAITSTLLSLLGGFNRYKIWRFNFIYTFRIQHSMSVIWHLPNTAQP